jgi:hypothetical protein
MHGRLVCEGVGAGRCSADVLDVAVVCLLPLARCHAWHPVVDMMCCMRSPLLLLLPPPGCVRHSAQVDHQEQC